MGGSDMAGTDTHRQVFSRPNGRVALNIALWGFGCLAVLAWASGLPIASGEFRFFVAFTAFCMAGALCMSIQRVVVDGTRVHVMSFLSGLRWRVFDAREVSEVRFQAGGHGALVHQLALSLQPAPHRSWKAVTLSVSSTHWKYHAGIDVPVLLAVMGAVAQVQPDLVVKGLPEDYAGVLPAPAPRP